MGDQVAGIGKDGSGRVDPRLLVGVENFSSGGYFDSDRVTMHSMYEEKGAEEGPWWTRNNVTETGYLTEAQLSVSDSEWTWLDIGRISDGDFGPDNLEGSTGGNSYYLETARVILPEVAQGDIADLDPMVSHFNTEGWEQTVSSRDQVSVRHEASAVTDDGWHIQYTVRENGQYSLQIVSNTFWGDRRGLQTAKSDRMVDYGPDASVPGVFATFPKWDDPIAAQ